jgi:hypothetical protein
MSLSMRAERRTDRQDVAKSRFLTIMRTRQKAKQKGKSPKNK